MRINRRKVMGLLAGTAATLSSAPALAATGGLLIDNPAVDWRKGAVALGVDTLRPRFTWTLKAPYGARDKLQSAVRLRIVGGDNKTAFDSGKVATRALNYRPSADLPLKAQSRYDWFLTVWDEKGVASTEAHAGAFVTGLLGLPDTKTKWIAAEPQGAPYVQPTWAKHPDTPPSAPLPILRKGFTADAPLKTAILSIAGLGQYQLSVNDQRISPNAMNGAWSEYSKRILYDTYDVTALMGNGRNWLAVELGNGFFNVEGLADRYRKYVSRYGPPQLWLQLRLAYADGREVIIGSDESWQVRSGPVTFTNIYGGEDYDARLAIDGWRAGRDGDAGWRAPQVLAGPGGTLRAHKMTPMKSYKQLPAKLLGSPAAGIYVYDCGINHSGRPMLRVKGLAAGTTVRIHPAELLAANGAVDQDSMTRWAEHSHNIEYRFTSAGATEEQWEPAFTYNGYRYLQIEGIAPEQIVSLSSDFLTDDFAQSGDFRCADERLNRIHSLIRQAVLSNAASYLTDCPDREKLGWLEQTYLNADTILLNLDAGALYEKMTGDIGDAQLPSGMVPSFAPEYLRFVDEHEVDSNLRNIPEWASSVVLTPWAAYGLYGCPEILAAGYPAMQAYAKYILGRVGPDGLVGYGIGDWYDFGPKPPGGAQLTSLTMTSTATLCHVFLCLAQITTLLNMPGAKAYADQSEAFKAAILKNLYDPKTRQFDKGSQAANGIALALDIAPAADRQAVLDNLISDIRSRQDHVSAGDVGFRYVVRALSMYGRGDVLYAMTKRDDKPSYGEQLASGATSLTEAWDGERVSSQNHFMLGHIESWFYRGLGGIDVDLTPAAAHPVTIAPDWKCGVTGAKVSYESVFGKISTDWERNGAAWRLTVEIPAGATAWVRLGDGRQMSVGSGVHAYSGKIA